MKDLEKIAADYKERLKSFKINPDQAKSILSQVEKMAKNSHNEWMKAKLANGWKLGPDNKENKTNPNLVPYDELDEETKEANRSSARTLLSLMALNECALIKVEDLTHFFAEQIHDAWSKQKISDGWKYGEKTDKEKKIHACLLPFDELSKEDQSYDWTTAKGIIDGIPNNMIFVSFKLAEAIQQVGSEK